MKPRHVLLWLGLILGATLAVWVVLNRRELWALPSQSDKKFREKARETSRKISRDWIELK